MHRLLLAGVALFLVLSPAVAREPAASDAEIRQQIIRQSIAAYPGVCACPESVMGNGRRCGGRSAYSRPGGKSPLCYPSDVTDAMVRQYKQSGVAR